MRKALFLLPAEGTGEKHGCVVMLFCAQPRASLRITAGKICTKKCGYYLAEQQSFFYMFTSYPHEKMVKVAIKRLMHRVVHIIHRQERAFLWKT